MHKDHVIPAVTRPAPPTHQIAHVAEGLPDDVDGCEGVQEQVLACVVQHSHEDEGTTSVVSVEQRQAQLRGRESHACTRRGEVAWRPTLMTL